MKITTEPDVPVPARTFVPADFDAADAGRLRALAERLLARPLDGAATVERFVLDWNELARAVFAERSRRRIAMTRDTRDEARRRAHLAFESGPFPAWQHLDDALRRRFLASHGRSGLDARYAMLDKCLAASAELYREENVALLAQDEELGAEYARLTGSRTVVFRGERMTTQRCAAFLEEPDRTTRREAYRAGTAAREADAAEVDGLFAKMLDVRGRLAANAGCADYREYRFRELLRFDYRPEDCHAFHDAVERVVVPAVAERMARRARELGVRALAPFDRTADPSGRPPLAPFATEEELALLGRRLFAAIDPRFAADFDLLLRNGLTDLMARPGKAPGAYCSVLADIRLPFLFANSVGRQRDVKTLLHEAGHAFHGLAVRDEPVLLLARAPIEFCEVASMTMELFGMERAAEIYPAADARRAARALLEERLWFLTWCATVDAFQHWLYGNPGHTPAEREEVWIALRRRFEPWLDWSGVEGARPREWHAQPHLFRHAFYYVEYGIALLGSVQVWRNYRRDPDAAVSAYRGALALGGTRPLPELFRAAGARFGLDEPLVRQVVGDLAGALAELDAATA